MDSLSKQQYGRPLLFCPCARFTNKEDEFDIVQFGQLPILSSSFHTRPLEWCSNIDGQYRRCEICFLKPFPGTSYLLCRQCIYNPKSTSVYHLECIKSISKHPYHPKHSLRLQSNLPSKSFKEHICLCCSDFKEWFYSCSICNFIMCLGCSRKTPVLKIDHPKRHEHTLFYFFRKESLTCDVCALSDKSLMYSCHQCDFVVHKECIYLPSIIKISRHKHRLSFSSSLAPERWLCGVCRGKIDTNYGRYSCVNDCCYSVHSKCAIRADVWDGKELEGTLEDAYEEETKSFNEISDGIIQHFSHINHHMRLDEETNRAFDENKRCQACTLPSCDDIIYSCMQCDFILHQQCAYLPRKKQHAMHPHPLTLNSRGYIPCSICFRKSNGYMYQCRRRSCAFQVDVCCASVSEPFHYQCHPHPLFLTSTPETRQICSICQTDRVKCLNCGDCGFALCLRCATLPNKMKYKHDEHFLTLSYDKDASGQYWCDVCEEEIDPKNVIFMCNDCNVTLHKECLLGKEVMYLMPGRIIKFDGGDATILANNRRLTRNICMRCHNRCQDNIFYKKHDGTIVCSMHCLGLYF